MVIVSSSRLLSHDNALIRRVYNLFDNPRREDNPFVNNVRNASPLRFESILDALLDEEVLSYNDRGQIFQSGLLDAYLESPTSDFEEDDSCDFVDWDTLEYLLKFNLKDYTWVENKDICEESMDLSVLEFYHRQLNPPVDYVDLLEDLGVDLSGEYDPVEKVRGKITGLVRFRHVFDPLIHESEEDVNPANILYPQVRGGYFNPAVRSKSCRSAGSRAVNALRKLSGVDKVVYLVLTFPEEVDELMFSDPDRTEERCWDAYKLFFDRIGWSEFGDLGHCGSFHGWSSANPFEPNCHFHTPIIWSGERDGHLFKLPDFAGRGKPVDFDEAKEVWAGVLNEVFGLDYRECYDADEDWLWDLVGSKSVNISVDFVPLSDRKRLIHKEKYRRRSPLVDLSRYLEDNDIPDNYSEKYLEYLVNYQNRARPHGFWTKLNRYQYRMCGTCGEMLKDKETADKHDVLCGFEWDGRKKRLYDQGLIDLETLNDNREFFIINDNVSRVCPVCGDPIEETGDVEVLPFDGDRKVFLSRHGGIFVNEPPPDPQVGEVEDLAGVEDQIIKMVSRGESVSLFDLQVGLGVDDVEVRDQVDELIESGVLYDSGSGLSISSRFRPS